MPTQLSKVSTLAFVGMTCALVASIRNVPDVAASGWVLFFYLIVATLLYAFPISLISGEYAGMFPKAGGPELWTTNALGQKWGFVTSWLLWVQMFPGMVMVASVLAPLLGNIFGDVSIGLDNVAIVICILVVYWIVSILNLFFDMAKFGGKIGSMLGIYIPFLIMFVLGIAALFKTGFNPHSTLGTFSFEALFPDGETASSLQYFAPIIFIFTGIELSSVYITRLKNPIKTYLRGIFIALIFMFIFNVVNGLVVANVVPAGEMQLNNITQSIVLYCEILGLPPIIANIFALCVFVGVAVQLSAWASGPSKTITQSARRGLYPPKWNYWKTNKYQVSKAVVLTQATIISIFSLVFLLGSAVNNAFLMLVNATTVIYCLVYIIMGVGILRLRKTHPDVARPFRVGKHGNGLIWLIVCLLFFTIIVAVALTLITSSFLNFIVVSVITLVLFFIPLIITSKQRPEWKDEVEKLMAEEQHNIPEASIQEKPSQASTVQATASASAK